MRVMDRKRLHRRHLRETGASPISRTSVVSGSNRLRYRFIRESVTRSVRWSAVTDVIGVSMAGNTWTRVCREQRMKEGLADVVATSPVEFVRPCRDDLCIGNDIDGKNGDFGAPDAKRTSSFFVSGRSASADCGELRMSTAVTMSSSGYQLKANSGTSADWYCWTNEDQFAPIYHELDPLVVAQEQLAYSSETSQSSPSSPYHMYQSIAEVRKEVELLKNGIADRVSRPTLSSVCDDVTSGELHESIAAPSNQSSSTKWAIFSRLRFPRRSSPTASSKTSNGNDVTKVNRSTTMTRLSLSPGSGVRNELATLEKITSPPHERISMVSPPLLPADRKHNSPSSPTSTSDR